jgi:hypothetical protein
LFTSGITKTESENYLLKCSRWSKCGHLVILGPIF